MTDAMVPGLPTKLSRLWKRSECVGLKIKGFREREEGHSEVAQIRSEVLQMKRKRKTFRLS